MKHELEWQQLGVKVGTDPEFQYRQDTDTIPTYPVFEGVDLNDGNWHRVAWSVYNENVQMWVDCKPVRDLELTRDMSTTFSLRGVFVFGKQAGEEVDVFEGDIESLVFDSDPTVASQMCYASQKLTPYCEDNFAAAIIEEPTEVVISSSGTILSSTGDLDDGMVITGYSYSSGGSSSVSSSGSAITSSSSEGAASLVIPDVVAPG